MDRVKSEAPSYAGHIHRDVTRHDGDMTITLDFEARFLRRKRMATDCGMAFMVDLAETVSLDAGDAFLLDDGRQIIIQAAAEPVVEIRHKRYVDYATRDRCAPSPGSGDGPRADPVAPRRARSAPRAP